MSWAEDAVELLREARAAIAAERATLIESYCSTPQVERVDNRYPLEAYDIETIDDRWAYEEVQSYGAPIARIDALIAQSDGGKGG
jgi:hypothetical protein